MEQVTKQHEEEVRPLNNRKTIFLRNGALAIYILLCVFILSGLLAAYLEYNNPGFFKDFSARKILSENQNSELNFEIINNLKRLELPDKVSKYNGVRSYNSSVGRIYLVYEDKPSQETHLVKYTTYNEDGSVEKGTTEQLGGFLLTHYYDYLGTKITSCKSSSSRKLCLKISQAISVNPFYDYWATATDNEIDTYRIRNASTGKVEIRKEFEHIDQSYHDGRFVVRLGDNDYKLKNNSLAFQEIYGVLKNHILLVQRSTAYPGPALETIYFSHNYTECDKQYSKQYCETEYLQSYRAAYTDGMTELLLGEPEKLSIYADDKQAIIGRFVDLTEEWGEERLSFPQKAIFFVHMLKRQDQWLVSFVNTRSVAIDLVAFGVPHNDFDTDGDGYIDSYENCESGHLLCLGKTDVNNIDTDGDGWWDGIEFFSTLTSPFDKNEGNLDSIGPSILELYKEEIANFDQKEIQTNEGSTGSLSDWKEIQTKEFSIMAPQGWRLEELQGIDSYVGTITNGEVEIMFDYGWYSGDPSEGNNDYYVDKKNIDGFDARLFSSRKNNDAGIFFNNLGGGEVSQNRLSLYASDLASEEHDLLFAIFETIKFEN